MSKPTTYRIAAWTETFETADSRKHKTLSWVSMPIDRQSSGYQSMVDHFGDDAPSIYGAWCALVSIAAACPVRGVLASSKGEPYSIQRIARMAFMPETPFKLLFEWASGANIGWLIECEDRQNDPSIDHQSIDDQSTIELPNPTLPNTTQQTHTPSKDGGVSDSQERKSPPKKNTRGYTDDFEQWWTIYPRKAEKPKAFAAFQSALERIGKDHHDDDPLMWLIRRTKLYAESVTGKEERYIKHPGPWLNADRFNDEPPKPKSAIGAGQRFDPECRTFGEGFNL